MERRLPIAILDSCSLLNWAPGSRVIRNRGLCLRDFPLEDRRDSYAINRGTQSTVFAFELNYRLIARRDISQTIITHQFWWQSLLIASHSRWTSWVNWHEYNLNWNERTVDISPRFDRSVLFLAGMQIYFQRWSTVLRRSKCDALRTVVAMHMLRLSKSTRCKFISFQSKN